MKMNFKTCAFSTVVGLCLLSISFGVLAQTRHALLIGINDYKTEEFADLRGAVNDVAGRPTDGNGNRMNRVDQPHTG